jgi:hypothetical protein
MLYTDIISVGLYCNNHTETINTPHKQSSVVLDIKAGGKINNHRAAKFKDGIDVYLFT